MTEHTFDLKELGKKLLKDIEEFIEKDEDFQKFKREFLKNYKYWKEEYEKEFKEYDIFYLIDLACRVRGLPIEFSHRLMLDFALFVIKCRIDRDVGKYSWLWKPKEWWYYFWRYYKVIFD